jgi:hypothetical protein
MMEDDRARAEDITEQVGSSIEGANLSRIRAGLCVLRMGMAMLDGFVSVATVKTHLVHSYAKLGIRSRAELAAQVARRAGSGGS